MLCSASAEFRVQNAELWYRLWRLFKSKTLKRFTLFLHSSLLPIHCNRKVAYGIASGDYLEYFVFTPHPPQSFPPHQSPIGDSFSSRRSLDPGYINKSFASIHDEVNLFHKSLCDLYINSAFCTLNSALKKGFSVENPFFSIPFQKLKFFLCVRYGTSLCYFFL